MGVAVRWPIWYVAVAAVVVCQSVVGDWNLSSGWNPSVRRCSIQHSKKTSYAYVHARTGIHARRRIGGRPNKLHQASRHSTVSPGYRDNRVSRLGLRAATGCSNRSGFCGCVRCNNFRDDCVEFVLRSLFENAAAAAEICCIVLTSKLPIILSVFSVALDRCAIKDYLLLTYLVFTRLGVKATTCKAKAKAKDLTFKAKAKAKDLTFEAKAKAKDLIFKAKAKAKDLTFKAKAKAKDLIPEDKVGYQNKY